MLSVARPWSFVALAVVLGSFVSAFATSALADEKEDALKAFAAFEGKWDTGVTITKTKLGRFVGTDADGDVIFVVAWDDASNKLTAVGFDRETHNAAYVATFTFLDGGKMRLERVYGDKSSSPTTITLLDPDTFEFKPANGETVTVRRVK